MEGDKALSLIYIFLRHHSVYMCLVLTDAFLVWVVHPFYYNVFKRLLHVVTLVKLDNLSLESRKYHVFRQHMFTKFPEPQV